MTRVQACCSEESLQLALQALLLLQVVEHLCESSWVACALVNQSCCAHLHSRCGLRALAARLPVAPLDGALRRRVWRRLCLGAMVFGDGTGSNSYSALALQPAEADAVIRRDICRTFPASFAKRATESLFRILRAVSHRLEDIGYCQGMNFIAGVFMRVFGVGEVCAAPLNEVSGSDEADDTPVAGEALAYQCVVSILLRHGMNQFFGDRFPKLRLTALQFDCLVEAFLPDLSSAFDVFNLSADFYGTQWFLTLFSYTLPFPHVVRIWDQFLCRGMKFIHRVGLALLSEAQPALLGLGFDGVVAALRALGQTTRLSPDALVAAALDFKVTNRLLSEIEHALAAGARPGAADVGRALPLCFPERDLDSGRTRWRLHAAAPVGTGSGGFTAAVDLASPASSATTSAANRVFLEDALPAPRIPGDPLAPYTTMQGEFTQLDLLSPSAHRHRAPRLKRLPRTVLQKIRNSSRGGVNATSQDVEKRPAAQVSEKSTDKLQKKNNTSASSRSSSMPSLRLRRPSRKLAQVQKSDCAAGTELCMHAYALETTPESPDPEQPEADGTSIPNHLLPFAVRDLDSGEWELLSDVQRHQALLPGRFSPPRRDRHRSWASKQVSKLRSSRTKHERNGASDHDESIGIVL